MGEREPPPPDRKQPEFGTPAPRGKRTKQQQSQMFPDGDDLPLFSGTPQEVTARPYEPEALIFKQQMLPEMPDVDWNAVLEADRRLRGKRRQGSATIEEPEGTIWETVEHATPASDTQRAEELLATFHRYQLDMEKLHQLLDEGSNLNAVLRSGATPEDVQHLLRVFAAVFRPHPEERIRSPADVAALLMTEMSHLDQEQLRVLCLDTKNRLQKMHLVYQGSLNAAMIRVGEVYKEPLRLNSAAIIVAHNHPSGDPTPSPEDVLVTRQIVDAGKLLDVDCLDHLVIGQGKWVSLRERGLGFGA